MKSSKPQQPPNQRKGKPPVCAKRPRVLRKGRPPACVTQPTTKKHQGRRPVVTTKPSIR